MRRALKYEVDMMKNFRHEFVFHSFILPFLFFLHFYSFLFPKKNRNIMRYYGSFFSRKTQELNIIMEMVSGGSLSKWILGAGCFTEVLSAHVIYQVQIYLCFIVYIYISWRLDLLCIISLLF